MGTHRFFHADRTRSLVEGQILQLDDGLSVFGKNYWHHIQKPNLEIMTVADRREYDLEIIRSTKFKSMIGSRMTALFAADTLDEAIVFANSILPVPEYDVPIFEIYAANFQTHDSNWLDYESSSPNRLAYYEKYWYCEITNHNPPSGPRRPPRLEVVIQLPAKVGARVALVKVPERLGEMTGHNE